MAKLTPEEAKERKRDRNIAWRLANIERARERLRRWCLANPEKVREHNRRRYLADPGKARKRSAAWRLENLETAREAGTAWRKANPERTRAFSAAYRGRRRAAQEGAPVSRDPAILDFYQFANTATSAPCVYCGLDPGPGLREVDHAIPISRGGAHSMDNLAIACKTCNKEKGSRTAQEYRTSLAYAGAPTTAR
jgi:5-methylcytosine-specific restriction endonuclease McrA